MKKYLSIFTILALAFVVNTAVIHAEDNGSDSGKAPASTTVSGKTPDNTVTGTAGATVAPGDQNGEADQSKVERENAKAKFEALKENLKKEKDAAKAKAQSLRLESREKLLTRFDEVVKNLTDLKAKISAHADALATKGVDVSAAKTFLAQADTDMATVSSKVAAISTLLSKSASTITSADMATYKTLAKDAQDAIKAVHKDLQQAVASLRQGVREKVGENKPLTPPTSGTQTNQ